MFCKGKLIAPCCGHSDVWLLSDPPIVGRITDQVLHLPTDLVPTYLVLTHRPAYSLTYIHSAVRTYLQTYLLTYLSTYLVLSTYLPPCLLTNLPARSPTYLSTNSPTFLHTCSYCRTDHGSGGLSYPATTYLPT